MILNMAINIQSARQFKRFATVTVNYGDPTYAAAPLQQGEES